MSHLKDERKKNGYSSEESYFFEENQRLIKELRKENAKGGQVIEASERFQRNVAVKAAPAKNKSKKKVA